MARVLVAVGSREHGEDFMAALLPRGLEVYIVDNRKALLEICRLRHPDLLIIDYDEEEYGGLEGLAAIRGDGACHGVRLVLYSRESGLDFVRATMRLGVVGYIPKPVGVAEIVEKLEHIIVSTTGGGQRREYVRVKPAPRENSRVELFLDTNNAGIGGILLDISLGGVAFRLSSPRRVSEIAIGETYPRFELSLPGESLIRVAVVAVLARNDTAAFKFNSVSEEALRALCRYIHGRLIDSDHDEGLDEQARLMQLT